VLRRIFGPKEYELTEGWGKWHSPKLHKLYFFQMCRMIEEDLMANVTYMER
jgi:hypothetical protein